MDNDNDGLTYEVSEQRDRLTVGMTKTISENKYSDEFSQYENNKHFISYATDLKDDESLDEAFARAYDRVARELAYNLAIRAVELQTKEDDHAELRRARRRGVPLSDAESPDGVEDLMAAMEEDE